MTYGRHRTEMLLTTTDPRAYGDARRLISAAKNNRQTVATFGGPVTTHERSN